MILPEHHCPGCGAAQKAFPRYPWHFCQGCLQMARTGKGQALEFANASLGGGLVWRATGQEEWQDATRVLCLIHDRPALVHEARFGGVVAEPVPELPLTHLHGLVDLRKA
jgi:hypothetical protein